MLHLHIRTIQGSVGRHDVWPVHLPLVVNDLSHIIRVLCGVVPHFITGPSLMHSPLVHQWRTVANMGFREMSLFQNFGGVASAIVGDLSAARRGGEGSVNG